MSHHDNPHGSRPGVRRSALLALALPLTLLLLALALPSPGGMRSAASAAEGGADGKAIFLAEKCNTCHGVAAAGIEAKLKSEKLRGPDLDETSVADHDRAPLVAFLRGKGELDGKEHKKPFKGSDEELAALIDWLLEQKAR